MREVPAFGIEPRRWTVVFHRRAENRFFAFIAMGHFKHVSAFAWLPELEVWMFYDVGFRRTRLVLMADGAAARDHIGALARGNALVTLAARTDGLPLARWGLFCTTAVAHLLGLRCVALRPDGLYRHMVTQGGTVIDDGSPDDSPARSRGSEPEGAAGRGAGDAGPEPAGAGAG